MFKQPIALFALLALCGALALGACSNDSQTGASTPGSEAATAGGAGSASAQPAAAAAVEPDYPQPAVVIPPRPKAGAPHGPGFDMPLIELGGYTPSRPMDV